MDYIHDDGGFSLEYVEPGNYTVVVEGDGYGSISFPVVIGNESITTDPKVMYLSNEMASHQATENLTFDAIKANNTLPNEIISDLLLPIFGLYNTSVTWLSSDPNIISTKGIINRSSYFDGEKNVTLTAIINKSGSIEQKSFNLIVKPIDKMNVQGAILLKGQQSSEGVKVVFINVYEAITFETYTNSSGRYSFTGLPNGIYIATAIMSGFVPANILSDGMINSPNLPSVEMTTADTDKPVITLQGTSDITLQIDSTYTDEGATAYDNEDGDITNKIVVSNPVNITKVGDYTIRYNVTDSDGNAADEVIRTVHVVLEQSIRLSATSIVQIGINPNDGDSAGIFVGLKDIKDAQGNLLSDSKLARYQFDVNYNPDQATVLSVYNEVYMGHFDVTNTTIGKVTVTDSAY